MSLKMSNLLDIEKYLLLELVYFHLPPPYKQQISQENPMKLDEYIDLVDQCGYSIYPGFISRSAHGCQYKKEGRLILNGFLPPATISMMW